MFTSFEESRPNTTESFPLASASRGETVTLAEICAGRHLRKRLCELGLNVGMCVHVIKSDCGQMILAVANDSRLALGAGMAQQIMVKRCPLLSGMSS